MIDNLPQEGGGLFTSLCSHGTKLMIPASGIIKGEKSRRSRCLVETFGARFPLPTERIRDEEAVWGELSQIAV